MSHQKGIPAQRKPINQQPGVIDLVSSEDEEPEEPKPKQKKSEQAVKKKIVQQQPVAMEKCKKDGITGPVVIGITENNGILSYLIKLPGKDMLELVNSEDGMAKYPRKN
jgi:hypothetical protein